MSKKIKRAFYYFFLSLLTLCSTLVIGLLSFGGMYALAPIAWLAGIAFVLAVLYEGEIYFRNTKETGHKLITTNYLQHKISDDFLKKTLKTIETTEKTNEIPDFFKIYISEKNRLATFKHKKLTPEQKKEKKRIKQRCSDMKKYFTRALLTPTTTDNAFQDTLQTWLQQHQQKECIDLYNSTRIYFFLIKIFAAVSAIAIGFGTIYLLFAEFTSIPLLMMLPLSFVPGLIIPMAIIAGIGYGFLIYNALTEMVLHKTIRTRIKNLWRDLKKGHIIFPMATILLILLTIVMTCCTAGTWWYIIKSTPPLFTLLTKIPVAISGIGTVIIFVSSLLFDLQNINDTLDEMETLPHAWQTIKTAFAHAYNICKEKEWWLQRINPFRIFLKLILLPLRLIFFLLHLLSIAATGDRISFLGVTLSFIFCLITELFIDWHYIMELHQLLDLGGHDEHHHDHGHGHDHHNDIPSFLIKCLFVWLYLFSAGWDCFFSQWNENPSDRLSFVDAWLKQWRGGIASAPKQDYTPQPLETIEPIHTWNKIYTISKLEKYNKKHGVKTFDGLISEIREIPEDALEARLPSTLQLQNVERPQTERKHFALFSTKETALLHKLNERIMPAMGG